MIRYIILAMQLAKRLTWLIPLSLLLVIGFYNLPPIHDRLGWRVDNLRAQVKYFFNPPDEAVFRPEQQVNFDSILATTRAEYALTLTPRPGQGITGTPTPKSGPTGKPTLTATPLPALVDLKGFKYEDQHNRWNYCGPANFSMALNFWGWKGNRDVVGKVVKPSDKDKNVMPYEFQDFISSSVPGMTSVMRYGGDIDVIRRFLAAGSAAASMPFLSRSASTQVAWPSRNIRMVCSYPAGGQTDLLAPVYYVSPELTADAVFEQLQAFSKVSPAWIPGDPGPAGSGGGESTLRWMVRA